jgi:hypothetical protein
VLAHRERFHRSACPQKWIQSTRQLYCTTLRAGLQTQKVAAVLIDGEATLKRVFLFADHIELRAENPAFPSIIRMAEAMNDVRIEGLAVGLCRKL